MPPFCSPRIAAIAFAWLASCEPTAVSPEPCTAGQTRCVGPSAQICDSGGHWTELMSCEEVSQQSGSPFSCNEVVDAGHTCLPVKP